MPATSLPALWISAGHDSSFLANVSPSGPIGLVGSIGYPPDVAAAGYAVARALDPISYQLQLPASIQTNPFKRLPFAASSVDPAAMVRDPAARTALIQAIQTMNRAWGATHLIAPYFYAMDPLDPSFAATIDISEATLDLVGSDSVIPAVFVNQNALRQPHLDDLLTQVTRTDFESLYLLVGIDSPGTAPVSDLGVIHGIEVLAQVLESNGISLLWGATDSTGLLLQSLTGVSFAIGPDTFLRRRRQPVPTARGGFRAPTPRVFVRSMLGELRVDDYQRWAGSSERTYVDCACAACSTRGQVAGRRGHYVNSHSMLVEEMRSTADKAGWLGASIDRALSVIGNGPSDVDARRHLRVWRPLLP